MAYLLRLFPSTLLVFATLLITTFPVQAKLKHTPAALFVFGDSYADTGNRNKSDPATNQDWLFPYGITYPGNGEGGGRFSDGRISTDFLAQLTRLPSPKPYASISSSTSARKFRRGINFAIGGAGAFKSYGYPSLSDQIDEFKGIIAQHPRVFSSDVLRESLVLMFNSGNDYGAFAQSHPNATAQERILFVEAVVQATVQDLTTLYHIGLRNFAAANLEPFGCLPSSYPLDVDACIVASLSPIASGYHNQLLQENIIQLQQTLPDAQFVILDLFKAFSYVLENPSYFGIKNPLEPCCNPDTPGRNCGDVDEKQNPLYTICSNRAEAFFWDTLHPTQAGWNAVANLLYSGYNITDLAPNLVFWINSLNLTSNEDKKESDLDLPQVLFQELETAGEYTKVLEIAKTRGGDFFAYLVKLVKESGPFTAFLPRDSAIADELGNTELGSILAGSGALSAEVALRHVVYGFWTAERLVRLEAGETLRTVSGEHLSVFVEETGIFLGAASKDGGVLVLEPFLFSAQGDLIVHGTDGLLLPPILAGFL